MPQQPVSTNQTQLDDLRQAMEQEKQKRVQRILKNIHPAKVASMLETLPSVECLALWERVDVDMEAKILPHLSPELKLSLSESKLDKEQPIQDQQESDVSPAITQLEYLRDILGKGKYKKVRNLFRNMHSAKIAGLLESLPINERQQAWGMVDTKKMGKILVHLHQEARNGLVIETDMIDLVAGVRNLALDELVDLIRGFPDEIGRELFRGIDTQKSERLRGMLSYPEGSAGGLMNTDHITVRADVKIKTVLRYLRLLDELPRHTDKLMVVDRKNRYKGILRIRHLVTCEPEMLVSEVMSSNFTAMPVNLLKNEVAQRFEDRDLFSAPVVDEKGKLLGRITVDDVIDIIREISESTLMNMAGLEAEDDMFAPVLISTRRRAIWLGINLLTAFLAAAVIGLFEATLQEVVALAVLMPIVASMGGIAGSQTLTLMIRGLALGNVGPGNTRLLLFKELSIAGLNGLIWALVVAVLAIIWFKSLAIGAIIGVAILLNLLCAALSGVAVPLLLNRMGIDPALAGSVILTTVTDVVGFFAFLGLATVILI